MIYLIMPLHMLNPYGAVLNGRIYFNLPILMKKLFIGIVVFIGVILLISIIGAIAGDPNQETNQQPSSEPANATEKSWQDVSSWSGSGIKKTEPFTITGDRWQVEWASQDTSGFDASILQIYVYQMGSDLPLEVLANAQGNTSDSSQVYKKGEFYLEIVGANADWTVSIKELK